MGLAMGGGGAAGRDVPGGAKSSRRAICSCGLAIPSKSSSTGVPHASAERSGSASRAPDRRAGKSEVPQRSAEIRHEFPPRVAQARESAALSAAGPARLLPRSQARFGNFRISAEFPGIGTNRRKCRDATPCATSVHWHATSKPLRYIAFSPSPRFERRIGPKRCRIAVVSASFSARM